MCIRDRSKEDVNSAIITHSIRNTDELIRGANGIAEGLPKDFAGMELPKFRPEGGLIIVFGGGGAGLFSTSIAGWLSGDKGSNYTTKEIIK